MPSDWVPTTPEKVADVVISSTGVCSVNVSLSLPSVADSSGAKVVAPRVSVKLSVTRMVVISLAWVGFGRGLVWSPT